MCMQSVLVWNSDHSANSIGFLPLLVLRGGARLWRTTPCLAPIDTPATTTHTNAKSEHHAREPAIWRSRFVARTAKPWSALFPSGAATAITARIASTRVTWMGASPATAPAPVPVR